MLNLKILKLIYENINLDDYKDIIFEFCNDYGNLLNNVIIENYKKNINKNTLEYLIKNCDLSMPGISYSLNLALSSNDTQKLNLNKDDLGYLINNSNINFSPKNAEVPLWFYIKYKGMQKLQLSEDDELYLFNKTEKNHIIFEKKEPKTILRFLTYSIQSNSDFLKELIFKQIFNEDNKYLKIHLTELNTILHYQYVTFDLNHITYYLNEKEKKLLFKGIDKNISDGKYSDLINSYLEKENLNNLINLDNQNKNQKINKI